MGESAQVCLQRLTDSALNITGGVKAVQDVVNVQAPLISGKEFFLAVIALSCILLIVASAGLVCNMLVLATYWKIGFGESINISYFALGLSDVGVLGTTLWGAILNLLHFLEVELPFDALALSSPTMYYPGEGFEKTTSCLTAYIALERCLCVLFPMHVKSIMTRRKTGLIIAVIVCLVLVPPNLSYLAHTFEMQQVPGTNMSKLCIEIPVNDSRAKFVTFLEVFLNNVVHPVALIFICICSAFLTVALKRNTKERETNLGQTSNNKGNQSRNKRIMKTVLFIAGAYIVFSTPKVLTNLLSLAFPRYLKTLGIYYRTYMITIILSVQLSLFNSSVNLFIYMRTSSKFRDTLQSLICSQNGEYKSHD